MVDAGERDEVEWRATRVWNHSVHLISRQMYSELLDRYFFDKHEIH